MRYKHLFNSFVYIKHNRNGASAARNIISKYCDAEILIYLDDDVYLKKNCLSQLVEHYEKIEERESHILAPSVRFPVGPSKPGKLGLDGVTVSFPTNAFFADYLVSALILVPKKIYRKVSWNERLRHGYDDTFYSLKCKKSGFKLAFMNNILATHDKEYAVRPRKSKVPEISSKVYTMLYKHVIFDFSLFGLFVLETYGLMRTLLWNIEPYVNSPIMVMRLLKDCLHEWFKGHFWFLRDLRDLFS